MREMSPGMAAYAGTLVLLTAAAAHLLMAVTASLNHRLQPMPHIVRDSDEFQLNIKDFDDADVHWFAQVTDLHLSKFRSRPERSRDLLSLCRFLKRDVRPLAALLTGDIVDAKDYKLFGSAQYVEEWLEYEETMRQCEADFPWLDIRGNHDTFDVGYEDSPNNMFRRHSMQGRKHDRSYLEMVEGGNGAKTCLVGVDSTPRPGLKRLFNFFGVLGREEVRQVRHLLQEADRACRNTVAFGHYPSSSVSASGQVHLPDLLADRVYLCGHYHTGYGHFHSLYSKHKSGMLELELGDWKDYRMYRLFAFDQGRFSFTDLTFEGSSAANAAIVVTHPTPARFAVVSSAEAEDGVVIAGSSVRALVFSSVPVVRVIARLDDGPAVAMVRSNSTPSLYTAPWDPSEYKAGLHRVTVSAEMEGGLSTEQSQHFSLDGSQVPFESWANVILLSDWMQFSALVFAAATFSVVASLAALRLCRRPLARWAAPPTSPSSSVAASLATLPFRALSSWLLRLSLLASSPKLCAPLVLAALYPCALPWCLGYVLGDRLAVVFVWGVLMLDGGGVTYAPPDMAFIVAGLNVFFFVVPLVVVAANAAGRAHDRAGRYERVRRKDEDANAAHRHPLVALASLPARLLALAWRHLGLALLTALLLHQCAVLWYMYGLVACLSPWGLGRVAFALWIYRRASNLTRRRESET